MLGFNTQLDVNNNIGKADPILINPNSEFKVTRVTGLDDNTLMGFYSLRSGVDSVRVIFNNQKVKVFKRTAPNPCDICDGGNDYQYFITEQDYQDAVDCNGNCE